MLFGLVFPDLASHYSVKAAALLLSLQPKNGILTFLLSRIMTLNRGNAIP